jgi:hypothetical protein
MNAHEITRRVFDPSELSLQPWKPVTMTYESLGFGEPEADFNNIVGGLFTK